MRKIIAILFTVFLVSCEHSVVSSRDAIVKEIKICDSSSNPEKYIIHAEYIEGPLQLYDVIKVNYETNDFFMFTDTKYGIGDTIRLSK